MTKIIALITKFLGSIPFFDKWFSKSTTSKVDGSKKDVRTELDKFKDENRPTWKK